MIRAATSPADRAAAVDVWRASRAAAGKRPSADALQTMAAHAEGLVVLLDEDGTVTGAAIGEQREDLLHVVVSVVHPDHRGGGRGSALVEGLADLAWDRGMRRAEVWCTAPAFYEACGFERSGETDGERVHLTADLEAPTRDVAVSGEIRLGQFLKRAELADTGSEAKSLIADGAVTVNDEVVTERGRQLQDGDVVRTPTGSARVELA